MGLEDRPIRMTFPQAQSTTCDADAAYMKSSSQYPVPLLPMPNMLHQQQTSQTNGIPILPSMSSSKLPPIHVLTSAAPESPPKAMTGVQNPPAPASVSPREEKVAVSRREKDQEAPANVEKHLLCRYRNKRCLNMRATKRNGELHNLCERHRARANHNQRRLETKKRYQKAMVRQTQVPRAHVSNVRPHNGGLVSPSQMTASGAATYSTFINSAFPLE